MYLLKVFDMSISLISLFALLFLSSCVHSMWISLFFLTVLSVSVPFAVLPVQ